MNNPRIIPYDPSVDKRIRNIGSLPRGTGAPYLEVIQGEGNDLIAKAWRRKISPNGIFVAFQKKA